MDEPSAKVLVTVVVMVVTVDTGTLADCPQLHGLHVHSSPHWQAAVFFPQLHGLHVHSSPHWQAAVFFPQLHGLHVHSSPHWQASERAAGCDTRGAVSIVAGYHIHGSADETTHDLPLALRTVPLYQRERERERTDTPK